MTVEMAGRACRRRERNRKRDRLARTIAAGVGLMAFVGCGTTKMTSTARTGTEQLLLTNAWDKALQKVDFRPLAGVPTFLDTTYITAVDQGWVVSSLRQAMLSQGVLLRPKAENAQFIVEARVGAYGTDAYNLLVGVPQVTVPPTFTGMPTGTIPEIPLVKKSDQSAVAKLALFAYDRASGQMVWSSGTLLDKSNLKETYVGGLGPFRSGSLQNGTDFNGIKIPIPGESNSNAEPTPKPVNPFAAPINPIQPGNPDIDNFAP
jgi:hypothetical protein